MSPITSPMTDTDVKIWQDENTPGFSFEILPSPTLSNAPVKNARLGILKTPHGDVKTPAFIFCATKAGIKANTISQIQSADTQIILSNTYHLMLQPGSQIIADHGGLHKFSGWNGPFLTDSGGFQVFSLAHGGVANEIKGSRQQTSKKPSPQKPDKGQNKPNKSVLKITEKGVKFKSYLDGSEVVLTPERSIEVQRQLGADIILTFDECTPFHVDKAYTAKSLELTHRWTDRSIKRFSEPYGDYAPRCGSAGQQGLYGISQGGIYEDLRERSAEFLTSRPFFGYAIGGSLGSTKEQMYRVVEHTASALNSSKPVHLLGIGGINDVFECVNYGIDTFDCVAPTRLARHAWALVSYDVGTKAGVTKREPRLNLKNSAFKTDLSPIDENCPCETCQTASRAYIHHLFKAKEMLGQILVTTHNIATMNRVMSDIRDGIAAGSTDEAREFWLGPRQDSPETEA